MKPNKAGPVRITPGRAGKWCISATSQLISKFAWKWHCSRALEKGLHKVTNTTKPITILYYLYHDLCMLQITRTIKISKALLTHLVPWEQPIHLSYLSKNGCKKEVYKLLALWEHCCEQEEECVVCEHIKRKMDSRPVPKKKSAGVADTRGTDKKHCRQCKQVHHANIPLQCIYHNGFLILTPAGQLWGRCGVLAVPQVGKTSPSQMEAMHAYGCQQGFHWWVKEDAKKNLKNHDYLD